MLGDSHAVIQVFDSTGYAYHDWSPGQTDGFATSGILDYGSFWDPTAKKATDVTGIGISFISRSGLWITLMID